MPFAYCFQYPPRARIGWCDDLVHYGIAQIQLGREIMVQRALGDAHSGYHLVGPYALETVQTNGMKIIFQYLASGVGCHGANIRIPFGM